MRIIRISYHDAMPATPTAPHWTDHAFEVLSEHGHRPGAPGQRWSRRSGATAAAWMRMSSWQACVATGSGSGVASVYRALALLSELGVLQRVPVAGGSARYELVGPGGDHHHHLVCDDCGATTPFEDEGLERAIGRLSRRTAYSVQAHDVTLHGTCPDCQRCVAILEQSAPMERGQSIGLIVAALVVAVVAFLVLCGRRRRRGLDIDPDRDPADADAGRGADGHGPCSEAAA